MEINWKEKNILIMDIKNLKENIKINFITKAKNIIMILN